MISERVKIPGKNDKSDVYIYSERGTPEPLIYKGLRVFDLLYLIDKME